MSFRSGLFTTHESLAIATRGGVFEVCSWNMSDQIDRAMHVTFLVTIIDLICGWCGNVRVSTRGGCFNDAHMDKNIYYDVVGRWGLGDARPYSCKCWSDTLAITRKSMLLYYVT